MKNMTGETILLTMLTLGFCSLVGKLVKIENDLERISKYCSTLHESDCLNYEMIQTMMQEKKEEEAAKQIDVP